MLMCLLSGRLSAQTSDDDRNNSDRRYSVVICYSRRNGTGSKNLLIGDIRMRFLWKLIKWLVGVNLNNDPEFETALKELESLAEACNMEVVGVETQNVSQINTGVYVGTGRVEEIKAVAHMMGAEVIIFDNTLSPMQLRNLKDIIERPVFDRTHLILQIFSSRARTREAQIQVETARLQYELPRLTGMGEILSRQGGRKRRII